MYRKALEVAPGRVTAHHIISVLLADEGRFDEALEEAMLEPGEWGRLTSLLDGKTRGPEYGTELRAQFQPAFGINP